MVQMCRKLPDTLCCNRDFPLLAFSVNIIGTKDDEKLPLSSLILSVVVQLHPHPSYHPHHHHTSSLRLNWYSSVHPTILQRLRKHSAVQFEDDGENVYGISSSSMSTAKWQSEYEDDKHVMNSVFNKQSMRLLVFYLNSTTNDIHFAENFKTLQNLCQRLKWEKFYYFEAFGIKSK